MRGLRENWVKGRNAVDHEKAKRGKLTEPGILGTQATVRNTNAWITRENWLKRRNAAAREAQDSSATLKCGGSAEAEPCKAGRIQKSVESSRLRDQAKRKSAACVKPNHTK